MIRREFIKNQVLKVYRAMPEIVFPMDAKNVFRCFQIVNTIPIRNLPFKTDLLLKQYQRLAEVNLAAQFLIRLPADILFYVIRTPMETIIAADKGGHAATNSDIYFATTINSLLVKIMPIWGIN